MTPYDRLLPSFYTYKMNKPVNERRLSNLITLCLRDALMDRIYLCISIDDQTTIHATDFPRVLFAFLGRPFNERLFGRLDT